MKIFLTLLLNAAIVLAQVNLPPLPFTYHTIVSANIGEKGYTVGWEEWYDVNQGLLRADGRFVDPGTTQVVDMNANMMYTFSPSSSCVSYNTSNIGRGSFFTGPVTNFFNQFSSTASPPPGTQNSLVYNGVQNSTRGIPVDVYTYTTTRTVTRNGVTTLMSYTAVQEWTLFGQHGLLVSVPVDIQLDGTITTGGVTRTFSHYYAFLEWSPIVPAGTFDLPTGPVRSVSGVSGCALQPVPPPRFNANINSTVAQTPQIPPPFPPIPNSFTTFVEIKVQTPDANPASSYFLSTPKWSFSYVTDPLTRNERIDFYDFANSQQDVIIYNYGVVDAHTFGRGTTYDDSMCTYTTIPSWTYSPLSAYRAGFVPELFSNSGSYSFGSYIGRLNYRGVPADTWLLTNIVRTGSDGTVYSFSSQVSFYPSGWQFPSRGYTNGFQPPMRVQNFGTQTSPSGVVSTYSDTWSFVYFLELVPSPSIFNPTVICPNAPTGVQYPSTCPVSSSTNNAAVGAAVFFALLTLVLIVIVIVLCRRGRAGSNYSTNAAPTHGDHTQLTETN